MSARKIVRDLFCPGCEVQSDAGEPVTYQVRNLGPAARPFDARVYGTSSYA